MDMMKCGHAANGESGGLPCCVICSGSDGWNQIVDTPDLSSRETICYDCDKIVPSDKAVAFFKYRPDEEYDTHYDGCRGWD